MQTDMFLSDPAGMPQAWTVMLEGRPVPYSLRKSCRARKVWLKVDAAGGLEVVVPHRMKLSGLEELIRGKSGWILDKIRDARKQTGASGAVRFEHGATLPYLGDFYRLDVRENTGGLTGATLEGGLIRVSVAGTGGKSRVREAVVGWYRAEAARYITGRVERLCNGSRPCGVHIRDQKSRWGSCSPSGKLYFNWRLMMSPPEVVDYLVIHELVHLERPDHSRAFWERVALRCPDYREREAWLKKTGRGLFAL